MIGPPSMMTMRFQVARRQNDRSSSPAWMVSALESRASCTSVSRKPVDASLDSPPGFSGGNMPDMEM